MHLDGVEWKRLLKSLKNICKESKLKEFQFNLINRIVVYRIKTDNECVYCGDHDSIDHLFKDCDFVKRFVKNVIDWFNAVNNSNLVPTIEEKLFGIMSGPLNKALLKKFVYTKKTALSFFFLLDCDSRTCLLP